MPAKGQTRANLAGRKFSRRSDAWGDSGQREMEERLWGQICNIDIVGVARTHEGMARPLRVNLAGSWNHAVSPGNGGEVLFHDDTDRRRFLGLVSELPERFALEVHAFALMSNHYHLLLRCREAKLSEAIRWLQVGYAGRFNWAHRRRGHVFQERFNDPPPTPQQANPPNNYTVGKPRPINTSTPLRG